MIEGLADFPRAPHLFRLALQIAPRHVQADGVAIHAVERPVLRDVLAAASERHHQLELVVHVPGLVGIREFASIRHQRVGVFLEEKRRFAIRVVTHLYGVGCVVAPHAVDTMHGKTPLASAHRETRNGRWRKNVLADHTGWY